MKTEHKIFLAIPFDSATRALYRNISDRIRELYDKVTVVTASAQAGPSEAYSKIATFKLQNRELHKQFVSQITDSDIVIADLTHNNPNVHIELGIALVQNKNILRVSGRSVKELGFDIQNLEVLLYKDEKGLREKIEAYLETFFSIKQLPLSPEAGPLYYREPMFPRDLKAFDTETKKRGIDVYSVVPEQFPLIRDGAVRVDFEIRDGGRMDDWFGVFFRADPSTGKDSHIHVGSYLGYARRDGRIEVVSYPGTKNLAKPTGDTQPLSGKHTLGVEFENDQVTVQLDDSLRVEAKNLSRQKAGRILLAALGTNVKVYSAEVVCRDTIEWTNDW